MDRMPVLSGQRRRLEEESRFLRVVSGCVEVYAVTSVDAHGCASAGAVAPKGTSLRVAGCDAIATRAKGASPLRTPADGMDPSHSFRQMFLMVRGAGEAIFPSFDELGNVHIELYAMEDAETELLRWGELPSEVESSLVQGWFSALVALPFFARFADRGDDMVQSWRGGALLRERAPLAEILARHQGIASVLLEIYFTAEDRMFLNDVAMEERRWNALFEESLAHLMDWTPMAYVRSVSRNPQMEDVVFVLQRAARALRLPERDLSLAPEVANRMGEEALLRRLSCKANLALRRVRLATGWQSRDNGTMIGRYGPDREMAALVPVAPGRYRMVTKHRPEGVIVTEEVASGVAEDAFACYAGLPLRKLAPKDLLKFLLRHCWKSDGHTVLAASFLAGLVALAAPIVMDTIFRDIIPILDRRGLVTVTQVSIVACFTTALVSVVRSLAVLRLHTHLGMAAEAALMSRVFALPANFFRRFPVGELVKRLMGLRAIQQVFSDQVVSGVFNLVFSFWSILLMLYYSVNLTVVALLIWLVYTLAMAFIYRNLVFLERKRVTAANKLAGILQQIFSGLSKFRLQGAESQAFYLWSKAFGAEWKWNLKRRWQGNYESILSAVQPLLASLLLYWIVGRDMELAASQGKNPLLEVIGTAEFLAFQTAFTGLNATWKAVFPLVAQMLTVRPHVENLRPILEEVPELAEDKMEADAFTGDIEVSRLTFAYADGEGSEGGIAGASQDVLHDMSFHIAAGEHVAIVGRSGCGKSTLIRCLLGFERPRSGAVYYDGQDLADLDPVSVRSQMGVVLQHGQLMAGDIFTNIIGTMNLSIDDAWAAAEAAGIADDIRAMPMGMHTLLSENSSNISGGQRQRILIARALAARPAIVIFDEATSALDNRAQAIVTESLDKLHATRIVVAHRLSTIRGCDRILVLDRGRIAEEGSFDELVARGGLFADMVKRQVA